MRQNLNALVLYSTDEDLSKPKMVVNGRKSYQPRMKDRPSITEIVSRYTELRRSGREFSGLCPLHSEKTPSFYVNEDKGTFYCHGCHEGGDVITFVMKIEGLNFKEALGYLGLDDQPRQTSAEIKRQQLLRETSRSLASWDLSIDQRVGVKLRELGQWLTLATDEMLIGELEREWIILTTLEKDLSNPDLVFSLWEQRKAIERLVGDAAAYSREELEIMHPPVTDAYKQQLISYVRGGV